MATIYWVWGGEATEEHRKNGRILSMSRETEKRSKTGSKVKRYAKYSVIGASDSSGRFNQDTRKPHVTEGQCWVTVTENMLDVARARVSNAGVDKQTQVATIVRRVCATPFTAFGSLEVVPYYHESHEEDSL